MIIDYRITPTATIIRFRKPDAEFRALREKEKGDWKNLTMEEKKKRK
jgi:hypothetical protein